jgi:hypothetical protein
MTIGNPNPGSDEAIAIGCKCPVIDNSHGKGVYILDSGVPAFWITEDCPIHAITGAFIGRKEEK